MFLNFFYRSVSYKGIYIADIIDKNISESEVAKAVTEDIENLKPSAVVQTVRNLTPLFLAIAYNLAVIAVILFISSRIIKLLSKMLDKFLQKLKIDPAVRRFLLSTFKILLYLLVVMGLAERVGISQGSIVAILGSAGVAIGLAWQGSLGNFAGGMVILFSKPFIRGDYIVTPKGEGSVDVIGIVYTVLITPDNKRITIPNGILSNDVITNVTANDIRRVDVTVGVSYNADIRRAKKLIKQIYEENGLILKSHEILTYVDDLGASAVILGGRGWCSAGDYWNVRWALLEEIKVQFDKNGIDIPYNQLDVHINNTERYMK